MIAIAKYILLICYRARFVGFLAILLGACFALATFVGHTALVEQEATARVLAAGAMRWVFILGSILFVTHTTQTFFESKEIYLLAMRPVSRGQLLCGLGLGYAGIVTGLWLCIIVLLLFTSPLDHAGPWIYFTSLWVEAIMMMLLSLAAGLILPSAVAASLACMAFYLFSRTMMYFTFAAEKEMEVTVTLFDQISYWVLTGLGHLLPRLDMFTQSKWLAYDATLQALWPVLIQGGIYSVLLLVMAWVDLSRKDL